MVHACTVGANALIGINAVVFDRATIGESAMVAAMAFIPSGFVVPPRHLAAGVPARLVRELSEADIAWKDKGTLAYQRLAGRSRLTLRPCAPLAEAEPGRRPLDITAFWPEDC